jgi:serine/threonine protein kinase
MVDYHNLNLSKRQLQKRKERESENLQKRFSVEDIRKVYKLGKVVGKGKFGCVRIAYHYSNPSKKLAIKSIYKDAIQDNMHLVELEHDIMKDVDHPNIVKVYETYMDKQFFHFVMAFCEGGDLFEKI